MFWELIQVLVVSLSVSDMLRLVSMVMLVKYLALYECAFVFNDLEHCAQDNLIN